MSLRMRARVAGSFSRSISFASPPSCAHGGMKAEKRIEPGRIGIGVGADIDARPARLLDVARRSRACGPSCVLPAAFRCQISTGMFASRPMRNASSRALMICVALAAHMRGVDAAELARLRLRARSAPRWSHRARARIAEKWTARQRHRAWLPHEAFMRSSSAGEGARFTSPITMRRTCVAPT